MNCLTVKEDDAYNCELTSLDSMLEEMEQRASDEASSNQSNACNCLMRGFDDDYVPTYLR